MDDLTKDQKDFLEKMKTSEMVVTTGTLWYFLNDLASISKNVEIIRELDTTNMSEESAFLLGQIAGMVDRCSSLVVGALPRQVKKDLLQAFGE